MKRYFSPFFRSASLCALFCLPLAACIFSDPANAPPPTPTPSAAPPPAITPQAGLSPANICFSLALPMQGPMKSVSEKIIFGASTAQRELEQRGTTLHVRLLDTDRQDWLKQLAALPPHCVVVGGPLQSSVYANSKNAQATRGRAFFTFLPQLESGDEGFLAWRFFFSPQDQTEALLDFAREMGFSQYGALHPDDTYGKRMTDIFRQGILRRGGSLRTASYTPGAAGGGLPDAAARLTGRNEINKTPFPTTHFHAVFLPDSWAAADQLISALQYNGEDKSVLFGTALWADGIQARPPALPLNYRLAVFPGPWNPALPGTGIQALSAALGEGAPDFWLALGYDFTRFAAGLRLEPGWNPRLVNQRLVEGRYLAWTMAPLSWDVQGKASQRLFVFTPTQNGFVRANPANLKNALAEAQARFAERMRAAGSGATPLLPIESPSVPSAGIPSLSLPGGTSASPANTTPRPLPPPAGGPTALPR